MTPRQSDVFNYIKLYVAERGFSPTFREIGDCVGIASMATVKRHVDNLIERGFLARDPSSRHRSLRVQTKPLARVVAGKILERLDEQHVIPINDLPLHIRLRAEIKKALIELDLAVDEPGAQSQPEGNHR